MWSLHVIVNSFIRFWKLLMKVQAMMICCTCAVKITACPDNSVHGLLAAREEV